MNVNTVVVLPWRAVGPARVRNHGHVRAYLRDHLPHATHLDADSGHEPFSRAGSRNLGIRVAADHGADIVVLCDADTLPDPDALHAAIEGAADGRLHLPYTWYRGLSEDGTAAYLSGAPLADCATELTMTGSTGGVLVARPDAWALAGGMDERFTGWGCEDTAFLAAADTLLGHSVRHPAQIVHLWHPKADGPSAGRDANYALLGRYRAAEGDPPAMRALIDERREAQRCPSP
ncbi:galactosyltransferase-related protein [Embleya sp. NPDC005971]|uniref:glycosyltransferase family 2 protein n=1 Tax=Embleya sp. NPDC005971 TaxID=3156724 RepID=UPI0033C55A8A